MSHCSIYSPQVTQTIRTVMGSSSVCVFIYDIIIIFCQLKHCFFVYLGVHYFLDNPTVPVLFLYSLFFL